MVRRTILWYAVPLCKEDHDHPFNSSSRFVVLNSHNCYNKPVAVWRSHDLFDDLLSTNPHKDLSVMVRRTVSGRPYHVGTVAVMVRRTSLVRPYHFGALVPWKEILCVCRRIMRCNWADTFFVPVLRKARSKLTILTSTSITAPQKPGMQAANRKVSLRSSVCSCTRYILVTHR